MMRPNGRKTATGCRRDHDTDVGMHDRGRSCFLAFELFCLIVWMFAWQGSSQQSARKVHTSRIDTTARRLNLAVLFLLNVALSSIAAGQRLFVAQDFHAIPAANMGTTHSIRHKDRPSKSRISYSGSTSVRRKASIVKRQPSPRDSATFRPIWRARTSSIAETARAHTPGARGIPRDRV